MSPLRVRTPVILTLPSLLILLLANGCGTPSTPEPGADSSVVMESNPELFRELQGKLSDLINETSMTYQQLDYDYAEDLLDRLDQYEAYFANGSDGDPPRFMPKLEAEEELDHIREVIRRWEDQTGKNLREEVDALKADVAARTGEEQFYPEFQKKFSLAFDDFIKVEVAEILERRNRMIHQQAETLLAPHREEHPEIVEHFEAMLATPQYALPDQNAQSSSPSA
ncbi:hypothetical protein [Tautonia marina]|uniref:hypothetical protein n=1 Tax=Tautonia marina TaxID=2653855 RepID=UPI001260B531|nr:hypothetical protein [Tautonia marina]